MTVNMLKSKIHRATVKQAELQYVGSITIDEALMEAAGPHCRQPTSVIPSLIISAVRKPASR